MQISSTSQGTVFRVNLSVIGVVLGVVIGLMLFLDGLHSARYPKLNVVFHPNTTVEPGVPLELRPVITKSKTSRAFGIARMTLGAGLLIYVLRKAWISRGLFYASSEGEHGGPASNNKTNSGEGA